MLLFIVIDIIVSHLFLVRSTRCIIVHDFGTAAAGEEEEFRPQSKFE